MADKRKHVSLKNVKKLTIDVVQGLGGDKKDLDLLGGLNDSDDEILEDFEKDIDADGLNKNEIREFIKSLGIKEHRKDAEEEEEDGSQKQEKKKKKVKLAKMPLEEEELEGTQEKNLQNEDEEKPKKTRNKYKPLVQHNEVSSTTHLASDKKSKGLTNIINMYKPKSYQLVKNGQIWPDKTTKTRGVDQKISQSLEEAQFQAETFASKLLSDEVAVYNKARETRKKSEAGWLKTVLSEGTLSDKVAALTLLVQESPVHSLFHLESLVNMAKKKGRRECTIAADTLKEMFISTLLPDRKLHSFKQFDLSDLEEQSGGNRDTVYRGLIFCYFESKLKECYSQFIKALQGMLQDNIAHTKAKALGLIFELLAEKPESEKILLATLVNKIGDPDNKIATKVTHLLAKLIDRHPNMKKVVVTEVEQLLYRPNVPERAQYYCICFLNQLELSYEDKNMAAELLHIYFAFFKACVKKGEVDSKMMSAILSGVNRAFPFAKKEQGFINEQINTLFKIVHVVNFNTSLQALNLLFQVMKTNEGVSDRYYTALYKKMLDPALKNSARITVFLNLLFKSIRADVSCRRTQAFIKRLLQICSFQSVPFICGGLVLLGEVVKSKPNILQLSHKQQVIDVYDENDDDDVEIFKDVPLDDDVDAVVKTEIEDNTEHNIRNEDSDDVKILNPESTQSVPKSSWVHTSNTKKASSKNSGYDPYHRNPEYCKAENECVWELIQLKKHYHPTVVSFAETLLKGESLSYSGDPLEDFTLMRFLDRFVYKNPKQKQNIPAYAGFIPVAEKKKMKIPAALKVPVNSDRFIEKSLNEIPVNEKFFHRYFTQRAALGKGSKKDIDEEDSDAESVADEEFDAFLDQYEKTLDTGDIEDEEDFGELDFSSQVGQKDDDESDEDDLDDLSDEEVDFGDDFGDEFNEFDEDIEEAGQDEDDLSELGDDLDEEDKGFSDEEGDEFAELKPLKGKKRKQDDFFGKTKKHKGDPSNLSGMFASADEFAHLMDDAASSKIDMTGSEALSNKDNAHHKQLKWEMKRDKWLKGENKKHLRKNSKRHGFPKKTGGKKKPVNFQRKKGKKGK